MEPSSFCVDSLGPANYANPLDIAPKRFIANSKRLAFDPHLFDDKLRDFSSKKLPSFEIAGPRQKNYFTSAEVKVAIVSCGGLCPGINSVIRALVMQLWHRYNVRVIWGSRYGYQGLAPDGEPLTPLNPENLVHIHEAGGSFLGSSRGSPPSSLIVDTLMKFKINVLFTIGGDGTMRGAHEIYKECKKRFYKLAIVGIPKTIDNDIAYVRQSFGFDTAVSIAYQAIQSGHNEAKGFFNGIGLVRLMGRHSGFIAASATLAAGHVNFCLVPEIPFALTGERGLFKLLLERLEARKHALIVVAEGAGQNFFSEDIDAKDASGNKKLGNIGLFLKEKITQHFAKIKKTASIKYIDPSYLIRSAPANPADQLFCARLAQNAVHAAMAGKTDMLLGYWHGEMTHVPLAAVNDYRQAIDPTGGLWFNVLEMTGQPPEIG